MPGIPVIEAVEIPYLDGTVDIWVPMNSTYDQHTANFQAKREHGDRLWYILWGKPFSAVFARR